MTKKSIATVVILTIVTCGIYGFWWMYNAHQELMRASGASGVTPTLSPVITLILAIFVSPVGFGLFGYDAARAMDKLCGKEGEHTVGYLILGIFLPIVQIAVVQNDINRLP